MSEFLMPSLGADMESAVLMEWKVKVGDQVTKGQVIAEVETSKGVIEIEIFEDGIIDKILIEPETECDVGTPLALIRCVDEKASKKRIKASPAARKKAHELGLDLTDLASKTKGGLHLRQVDDLTKTIHKKPDAQNMRQAIAAAMSRSNSEIPHYYLSASINMTMALSWLEELNKNRTIKERILPAALLIYAVARVLKDVPKLNGFWIEDKHQVSSEIHPGIAIALRKEGLMTPALLDADKMNLDQTMHALGDLILRTRSGKLKGAELTKQTITITNLGDIGVESVYGVIYPPQVAIVGLGRIIDSPWVQDGKLTIQKIMKATLSGDHRATDGRTGALFLEKLNHFLQNPKEIL